MENGCWKTREGEIYAATVRYAAIRERMIEETGRGLACSPQMDIHRENLIPAVKTTTEIPGEQDSLLAAKLREKSTKETVSVWLSVVRIA